MSRHDLVNHLIVLLEAEADGLEKLYLAMKKSRTAWLALRPDELQSAMDHLQRLADHSAEIEGKRQAVVQELEGALRLPQGINVSRLSSHLSKPDAERLKNAARRASKAAGSVRGESGMGARLLDFSRQSQESMFHSVARLHESQARSYDHTAKSVARVATSGSLIDGRL